MSQYDILRENDHTVRDAAMYRICWKSRITGETGHGEYCLSHNDALALVKELNETHPDISHWSEIDLESKREQAARSVLDGFTQAISRPELRRIETKVCIPERP